MFGVDVSLEIWLNYTMPLFISFTSQKSVGWGSITALIAT